MAGFLFGMVTSMPIAGPVSIFVFQRGLSGKWKAGLNLAIGAAITEAGWCLVVLLGAEQILERWLPSEWIARAVGMVILLVLGIYFLTRKAPVVENNNHSQSAGNFLKEFVLGFSLVAGNPAMPFNWLGFLTIAVGFGFRPAAGPPLLFVAGVALGIIVWFAILLKLLDHFRTRVAPDRIQLFMRGMGLLMIATAIVTFFYESVLG